jgi:hypothetical protein
VYDALPQESRTARVQLLIPNCEERRSGFVLHLAGTGDHYFARRLTLGKPLLAQVGCPMTHYAGQRFYLLPMHVTHGTEDCYHTLTTWDDFQDILRCRASRQWHLRVHFMACDGQPINQEASCTVSATCLHLAVPLSRSPFRYSIGRKSMALIALVRPDLVCLAMGAQSMVPNHSAVLVFSVWDQASFFKLLNGMLVIPVYFHAGMCGFSMGGVHASMVASLYPGQVACVPLLAPRSAAAAFCYGALWEATAWEPLVLPVDEKQQVYHHSSQFPEDGIFFVKGLGFRVRVNTWVIMVLLMGIQDVTQTLMAAAQAGSVMGEATRVLQHIQGPDGGLQARPVLPEERGDSGSISDSASATSSGASALHEAGHGFMTKAADTLSDIVSKIPVRWRPEEHSERPPAQPPEGTGEQR